MSKGSFIEIKAEGGQSFKAYLSLPEKGSGPGIVLLQEIFGINPYMREQADLFAAEGYVAIVPDLFWRMEPGIELGYHDADFARAFDFYGRFDVDQGIRDIATTIAALRGRAECSGGVGALGYCLGGKLAYLTAARTDIDCAIGYYGVGIEKDLGEAGAIKCPLLLHFAENDKFSPPEVRSAIREAFAGRTNVQIFDYPGVDHAFATSGRPSYDKPSTLMAHSRTISLLRGTLGPSYDLEALWEKHCLHEFGERDVAATMATMVEEPYVNHIPTLTGGTGFANLARFYKYHFVDANPGDTRMVPVSRTIGADRLVDEMLFCFTHDREIDWLLPGVKPTGKYVEVPLVAIVCFRGGKLYNEHIYWDQASVLAQIGLLDTKTMPVAGIESARKLLDETLPSNEMMANWSSSAGKPAP